MAEVYPSTLPLPEHIGYTNAQTFGVVRTTLPGPGQNQEVYYNAPREVINAEWAMDDATYATWLTWMNTYGYDWFYLQVVSARAPVDITSAQLVRVSSPISRQLAGYNWQRVSLELELVPGAADDPLAPGPEWDYWDAGVPAAPATDIIDGGSPASPSPGLRSAQLYDY